MITYSTSQTEHELRGILDLQHANLLPNLSDDEIKSQGFVTVVHSMEALKKLNDIERHVIAKDDEKLVAYVLAMTAHSSHDIPILIPMFDIFNKIVFGDKRIADYSYIVVGQVCVAKDYRGLGIFDRIYAAYRQQFELNYEFAITEIAANNQRSLNAHRRVGFQEINRYTSGTGVEWIVVIWNWNSNKSILA